MAQRGYTCARLDGAAADCRGEVGAERLQGLDPLEGASDSCHSDDVCTCRTVASVAYALYRCRRLVCAHPIARIGWQEDNGWIDKEITHWLGE